MDSPRIGELFAGYGGLGMGVQAALGGEMVWYSEIDKGALKILEHRFPDVPNIGDITAVDWSTVEPVDILTGGSPCQDLSHAGKRAGMTEGTRSNLWVAMREAIAQLRPGLVIWENVRGAYSAAADSEVEPCAGCVGDGPGVHLRALGRVLGDLSELGYVGGWHGLRAADVGAPHGRFRVFVVAHLPNAERGGRDRWTPLPRRSAIERTAPQGAGQDTLLSTPQSRDYKGVPGDGFNTANLARDVAHLSSLETRSGEGPLPTDPLLPTPAVNDMGAAYTPDEWDAWCDAQKARHGNGNGHGKSLHIEAVRLGGDDEWWTEEDARRARERDGVPDEPEQRLLPTPVVTDAKGARNATSGRTNPTSVHHAGTTLTDAIATDLLTVGPFRTEKPQDWGIYYSAICRWEALTRPAPSPTEVGPKGSARLASAFSEWLMGLPAGWVTDVPGITRNEALKALGNGVVPQQAEAAIRAMLAWEVVA